MISLETAAVYSGPSQPTHVVAQPEPSSGIAVPQQPPGEAMSDPNWVRGTSDLLADLNSFRQKHDMCLCASQN